jgi:hypothetical protein
LGCRFLIAVVPLNDMDMDTAMKGQAKGQEMGRRARLSIVGFDVELLGLIQAVLVLSDVGMVVFAPCQTRREVYENRW